MKNNRLVLFEIISCLVLITCHFIILLTEYDCSIDIKLIGVEEFHDIQAEKRSELPTQLSSYLNIDK